MIFLSFVTESIQRDDAELEKLISKIAEGDNEAFAQVYEKTKASVYGFSLSILKNDHDAQDVLQNCFVKIHSAAVGYVPKGKPMAWILTITRNLCFDHLREQKRNADIYENDAMFTFEDANDDKIFIRECMEKLSDDERQILMLHAVSGFKHRETAELLKMPVGTVLSKYNRAIKKIQESYKGGHDVDGI